MLYADGLDSTCSVMRGGFLHEGDIIIGVL